MPPFGLIPWLFLIPALVIASIGIFMLLFRRTSLGKARRKHILDKYEIVTGPEREKERKEREKREKREKREDAAEKAGKDEEAGIERD